MNEQRNLWVAIASAVVILIGWQFFFAPEPDPQVREAGDLGVPTVISSRDSRAGEALLSLMHAVDERLSALTGT